MDSPERLKEATPSALHFSAVVFPVGAVVVENRLLIYAGAADKYIILLGCRLDKLIDYLFEYCRL